MEIYVVVYWCDGFGNDSYVGSICSSLEKAVASVDNYYREKYPYEVCIVKTCIDNNPMDFDWYSLLDNFSEVYDCFGRREEIED